MSPAPVTDALAHQSDIVTLARLLGKGRKRDVFAAVYEGKAVTKSVAAIADKLSLTEKQVLDVGISLVQAHAVAPARVNGKMAYSKIPSIKAIRDPVLRAAGDPLKIAQIATKRNPIITGEPIFRTLKPSSKSSRKAPSAKKLEARDPSHVIAMLLSSPIGEDAIDVSMEAREVENERLKSENGAKFSLKIYPAAVADSLTHALNYENPKIIHFSGHGGSGSILLDNESIKAAGGTSVNLSVLARILKTAPARPKLLVLNACDTLKGADRILDAVDMVIAMSDPIPDSAAYSYSRRLYAAIFAGLNIYAAHEQAKAVLEIDEIYGASLPTLLSAPGTDPKTVTFS